MLLLTAPRLDKPVSSYELRSPTAADIVFTDAVPKRVLIVEDNDLNRQMLQDFMVFCGYQVLSIAGGSGFFEALTVFQPQLILLDLKLPDIDGYILLEQLQQKPDWQHIPVIIVSAFAFKAEQQRALSLGARSYFVKPVNLSDLSQAVEDELSDLTT